MAEAGKGMSSRVISGLSEHHWNNGFISLSFLLFAGLGALQVSFFFLSR